MKEKAIKAIIALSFLLLITY